MTVSATAPKYKLNDQVKKKETQEKYNVRGRICYYYGVKWPDGRRSEHAQHILVPAP